MSLLRTLLVACTLLFATAPSAFATPCPAGAVMTAPADGQRVKIVALHPDDAYFSNAADLIGVSGVGTGLEVMDTCWIAGSFQADNGESYYFFKAAMFVTGGAAAPQQATVECPDGATSGNLADGTPVRIAALHPDDAFYSDRGTMVGVTGRVKDEMHSNEGCWLGGAFVSDSGDDYYFYKAAMVPTAEAPPAKKGKGNKGQQFTGSLVRSGTRFIILDVHSDDAYYGSRGSVIGKSCRATGDLEPMQPGWFAGPATCDDGSEYYFFKVGVSLLQ